MTGLRQGSIRLFRFAGIDLFLHWSWFLVAAYEIQDRSTAYSSVTWNVLEYLSQLPRQEGFLCPSCKSAPPVGELWLCATCNNAFDTFKTQAVCPHCAARFATTACLDCGKGHAMSDWAVPMAPVPMQEGA